MGLFRTRQDKLQKALAKILKGCEAPTFPQLVVRILQKVRDPEATMDEIVEHLQWDPGLVVRILRTVNTAAYGPANPIRDVAHAVSYMGRSPLEQLVLALAVKDAMPSRHLPSFDAARFWVAASRRAALARRLAGRLHPATQTESFTAGLLQDMALPVLAAARGEEYGPVLEAWHADKDVRLAKLEKETFGWDHAEVGALLGGMWELPQGLVAAIGGHHRTDLRDDQLLPAIRLVALLRESEPEDGVEEVIQLAHSDYGLDPDWTRKTAEEASQQASELGRLMIRP